MINVKILLQPHKKYDHTVWRTWLFIAYSDEKWLYYKFSLHHSYSRILKGWENTLFELRSERVKRQVVHTVWWYISGEAAGKTWNWLGWTLIYQGASTNQKGRNCWVVLKVLLPTWRARRPGAGAGGGRRPRAWPAGSSAPCSGARVPGVPRPTGAAGAPSWSPAATRSLLWLGWISCWTSLSTDRSLSTRGVF